VFRVSAHVLLDLHHQLTSRRDYQRARAAGLTVRLRRSQFHYNRQNESRCLSRARLRNPDHIVSRENERDRRDLNRSRLGVARVVHGLYNLRRKIECAEWHE